MVTLSYLAAERVVPHYNMMGVAKAALEASVRYLAYDLGPQGVRVNAISAGPVRTVAARSIAGFGDMYAEAGRQSMLRRNITAEEVGRARPLAPGAGARAAASPARPSTSMPASTPSACSCRRRGRGGLIARSW